MLIDYEKWQLNNLQSKLKKLNDLKIILFNGIRCIEFNARWRISRAKILNFKAATKADKTFQREVLISYGQP